MLNRIVLLSTLALLAAGELTNQAIANPNLPNSTAKPTASNYVVPVEASPASQSAAAIASPEASVTPVFSQSTQPLPENGGGSHCIRLSSASENFG
jgi:hypothetical protein